MDEELNKKQVEKVVSDVSVVKKKSVVKHQKKEEVIEIPVGKIISKIKNNPWMAVSFVLFFLLILSFGFRNGDGGVGEKKVEENVLNFVNRLGQGEAEIVSVEKNAGLYLATVKFQGNNIPVYTTLDGKYLIQNPVPLTGDLQQNNDVEEDRIVDNVEYNSSPYLGEDDAPIVFVEFVDYQCPFCKKFYLESYEKIISDYVNSGKVRYVMMDYPLDNSCNSNLGRQLHPEACKSAEAGRCVREQAKDKGYFEMHKKLFDNQEDLNESNYKKWAREISGVNGMKFDNCLMSGKYADEVEEDIEKGNSYGVQGTPAFFINGKFISGAVPYSEIKRVIEEFL